MYAHRKSDNVFCKGVTKTDLGPLCIIPIF